MELGNINLATMDHVNRRVVLAAMVATLLVLVAATGFNLIYGLRYAKEKGDYRGKMDRIAQMQSGGSIPAIDAKAAQDLPERIRFTNRLIAEDRFPWIRILDVVEETLPPGVILSKFQPSGDFLSLSLSGRAVNVNELVRFHKALEGSGLFQYANLSTLSLDQPGDAGGLQFDIDGRLRVESLFTGADSAVIEAALQRKARG